VAIIIIVVIVVLVYIFVIRGTSGGNKKRAIEDVTNTVASSFMAVAAPHAKRLEARAPIDEALAQEMVRISRERFHFPQILN
jgi:syntaxin 1B/2/3